MVALCRDPNRKSVRDVRGYLDITGNIRYLFTRQHYRQDSLSGDLGAMRTFMHILRETRGATAIEYGLIAALIAVAAITAMSNVGKKLTNTFNNVQSSMKAG